MKRKGLLVVVSGPAGVGKGTLCKAYMKKFDDMKIVLDGEAMEFSDEYKKFLKTEIRFEPERTECGFHILPDRQNGAGPIWFSVLEKT